MTVLPSVMTTFPRSGSFPVGVFRILSITPDESRTPATFLTTRFREGLYNTGPFFVEDPHNLLTHLTHGHDGDPTLGKTGKLIVPKVSVNEVRFHDHTVVKRDNGQDFPPTYHWKGETITTGVGDESNPVAYVRNTSPKISAKIKVEPKDFLHANYTKIKVRATGPDGISFPSTGIPSGDGIIAHVSQATCTGAFPNTIKYYDKTGNEAPPFQLDWEVSYDNGTTWSSIGNTKHTIYVTRGSPLGDLRQETLFYHGCKHANGKETQADMLNAIWAPFTNRVVRRVDGVQLTYYKTTYLPILLPSSTAGLLAHAQGDGRCGAWAEFLLDILKMQGFKEPNNLAVIEPSSASDKGFIVKGWTFHGSGTSGSLLHHYMNRVPLQSPYIVATNYVWTGTAEVTYTSGTPGQGNAKPAALFNNHGLAVVNGIYCDPSYGVTYANLQEIDNMLSGFYSEQPYWTVGGVTAPAVLFRKNPAGVNVIDTRRSH